MSAIRQETLQCSPRVAAFAMDYGATARWLFMNVPRLSYENVMG